MGEGEKLFLFGCGSGNFMIKNISNTHEIHRSINPIKNSILKNLNENEDVDNLMNMLTSSMKLFNKIKTNNFEGNFYFFILFIF